VAAGPLSAGPSLIQDILPHVGIKPLVFPTPVPAGALRILDPVGARPDPGIGRVDEARSAMARRASSRIAKHRPIAPI